MVSTTAKCKGSEKRIVWNIKGAVGPQGPAGADGAQGVDGEDGVDGINGTNGIFLTARDFEQNSTYSDASVTYGSYWMAGHPHSAWKLPDSYKDYTWLQSSVPVPDEWRTAKSLTITGYYSTSVSGGVPYVGVSFSAMSANTVLGGGGVRSGVFASTPTEEYQLLTGSSNVTAATLGLSTIDMLEVGFDRYNKDANDTNTGTVFFLGMRITPNF